MDTKVGIVGAGPAGLLLAHLLRREGVDCVVIEARSRAYVEERVRAGVLEQGTVDLLRATGVGARMDKEGLLHDGVKLRFQDRTHRIDIKALTGRAVMVYAQHEVVKDLIAANLAAGVPILFEAEVTRVEDAAGERPRIVYKQNGAEATLACDFIAGCDGFHGRCREAAPAGFFTTYDRVYPFGWLGILAEAPPASHELVYANHERGFALQSMRTPGITRAYVQCAPDEDIAQWPDERIWAELKLRLAASDGEGVNEGRIFQKGVTAMRSFVTEPMQYGRLFLAGDSAHIVPPTGAKGLNLAAHDVFVLAGALAAFYRTGAKAKLEAYSDVCLRRIWRAQHFSWWMTSMLHKFPDVAPFDRKRQFAELDAISASEAGSRFLAENYAGHPFE
ncbi:MAG: 4-hydroxybenzoate 3-monooxygenase [Hyphomonadaceae bacterium]|nr:4-hydroxybenzoate 3-monooxygenase [Hyphomonadaceae bacterium]